MISDQMLLELINKNREPYFQYEKISDVAPSFYAFARGLIALAHEVMPLEFVQTAANQKEVVTNYGIYKLYEFINVVAAKFPNDTYFNRHFSSEAEAMRAAQADFNRRVLENLAHGGAE